MIHAFVIENDNGKLSHIETKEVNPRREYHEMRPSFTAWKKEGENRKDHGWEYKRGKGHRFYLHSATREGKIRILILFYPEIIGDKDILSEVLEDRLIKLLNHDYSNLKWWFDLEQDLK